MLDHSDEVMASELLSGETLLWSGRSRPGIVLHARDWFQIPFGVLFLGAAVTVVFSVLQEPKNAGNDGTPPLLLFSIFLLPWFLIGSYFTFGHLLWERYVRARSTYGLTDHRAIIVQQRLHTRIKSIPLKDMADVTLTVGRDGVGTVTFNESANPWPLAMAWGFWGGYYSVPAFELVGDARQVYKLIVEARARLRT